jgi:hypothetical protein
MEAYFHLIRPPCTREDLEAASREARTAAGAENAAPRGAVLAGAPMTRGQRRRARGKAKQEGQEPSQASPLARLLPPPPGGGDAGPAEGVWQEAGAGAQFSHVYCPGFKGEGPGTNY